MNFTYIIGYWPPAIPVLDLPPENTKFHNFGLNVVGAHWSYVQVRALQRLHGLVAPQMTRRKNSGKITRFLRTSGGPMRGPVVGPVALSFPLGFHRAPSRSSCLGRSVGRWLFCAVRVRRRPPRLGRFTGGGKAYVCRTCCVPSEQLGGRPGPWADFPIKNCL